MSLFKSYSLYSYLNPIVCIEVMWTVKLIEYIGKIRMTSREIPDVDSSNVKTLLDLVVSN